jgi:hypothetical protein
MSGATKAGNIAGCITVCAEVKKNYTHSSQSRLDQRSDRKCG